MAVTRLTNNTSYTASDINDIHDEMVAKDGSQQLTSNWDAGAYEIRALTFESDVSSGTAPLTIASTTAVSNLNVEWLNGYKITKSSELNTDITITTGNSANSSGILTISGANILISSEIGSLQLISGDDPVTVAYSGIGLWVHSALNHAYGNGLGQTPQALTVAGGKTSVTNNANYSVHATLSSGNVSGDTVIRVYYYLYYLEAL